MLNSITPLIRKLINHINLSEKESESLFNTLNTEDTEGYYWVAATTALHTKGETVDELLGFVKSLGNFTEKLEPKIGTESIIDISGTGGDRLKTFNVSTTASLVIAGGGITVGKQSAPGYTGVTGSRDIFEEVGIPITKLTKEQIENALEKVGFCPYHRTSFSPRLKNQLHFLKKIREIGLTYRMLFHIGANAFSPLKMYHRIYGCFDEKWMQILAHLFQKLQYKRGLIVFGDGGLDEISIIGQTRIIEFTSQKIKKYNLLPKDLGLRQATYQDIKAGSRTQNIIDFLRILKGKEKGAKRDLVLANSGAAFYVLGKTKSIKEGVELSKKTIDAGLAWEKLIKIVELVGDPKKLKYWENKI
ncbi:anthranilate phosphoribosyltransferase [Candidatus Roizmanbacteria bacterium]|nr:anthranilate phosphoribosyltransferase [Candidatus Roizmanbacteria bacterium]